jgi:D-amino-acid dehydrogenase
MSPLLIIGGGLIGLATAQVLVERGVHVRVLEAREGVGLEASFANGGLLTPSMPEPWNGPGAHRHLAASLFSTSPSMRLRWRVIPSYLTWGLRFLRNSTPDRFYAATEDNYRLAEYSRDKTRELTERLQLDYDLLDAGILSVFQNAKQMAERQAISQHLARLGMRSVTLDRDAIVAREPLLREVADRLIGGFWFPDDASGDAYQFCKGLASEIIAGGAEINTGMQATGLIARNGKMLGVDTNRGRIDTDRVVVAAGVHSPALLRGVGQSLPIKPAKGYSVTVDADGLGELPGVAIQDDELHAVISRFGKRIRVVGTADFAGLDKSIGKSRIDHLFGVLESLLPDLASRVDRDAAEPWAGLRPMSSDGRPFIGPANVEGLYVNAGHGALGWTMAMGSAHLLADQILERSTEIDGSPFMANRVN